MKGLLAVVLACAFLPGGLAQECPPRSTIPDATVDGGPAGTYYVDIDCFPTTCDASTAVWVLQETNGVEGLQRRDFQNDDTCGGAIPSDTYIL